MAQYINLATQATMSLGTGSRTLFAVVNNSGSSVVKLFDGKVNPLLPTNGKITGSAIATLAFNATPMKVDYGIRTTSGLVVASSTGDITIIYE
jgi:hypothetical protein